MKITGNVNDIKTTGDVMTLRHGGTCNVMALRPVGDVMSLRKIGSDVMTRRHFVML